MTSSRSFVFEHVKLDVLREFKSTRTGYKIISTRNILDSETPFFITKTTDGKVVGVESEKWGFADAEFDWYPLSHHKEWLIFYGWYFYYVSATGRHLRRIQIKPLKPLNTGDLFRYSFVRTFGKNKTMRQSELITMMIQRTQDRTFIIDKQFCESDDVIAPHHPREWNLPLETTYDDIYYRFRSYMNLHKHPQNKISFSGTPSGMMHDVHMFEICDIYKGMKGEKFVSWEDIKGKFSYGVAYKKPKKNGELRRVFPMSPKLNAFITQEYGAQSYILPQNVKEVRGCKFKRMKYSYDVKNCDYLVLPYFRRLIRECYPEDEDKLLAKVKFLGDSYNLPQFPSGICTFMKYTTTCFTAAYLGLENYEYDEFQIQGDGVFSNIELDIDGLEVHREQDYVINGFFYDHDNKPYYVNADKRLTTPQILGMTKIKGEALWKFRREIYTRFLNGRVTVRHHIDALGDPYKGLTDRQIFDIARSNDIHIQRICDVLEAHGDEERLAIAKEYLRIKEYHHFNKSQIWDGNPSRGHLG